MQPACMKHGFISWPPLSVERTWIEFGCKMASNTDSDNRPHLSGAQEDVFEEADKDFFKDSNYANPENVNSTDLWTPWIHDDES